MLIFFFFFFASALSALHLYNEPKFMVIGNPVILEQYHAHNAPDLWDRGSTYIRSERNAANSRRALDRFLRSAEVPGYK